MDDNHGRGIALENAELVQPKIEAAKHVGVGVDPNEAALLNSEVALVESVYGLSGAVGGNGGQEAKPAGMNAQNRNLKASNVGHRIEQGTVAADAEHKLHAAQGITTPEFGGALGQAQPVVEKGSEGFANAYFGAARGQIIQQGLDGWGSFVIEGFAENGDFHAGGKADYVTAQPRYVTNK